MLGIADAAALSPGLLTFHFEVERRLCCALLQSVITDVPALANVAPDALRGRSSLAQPVEAEIRRACADVGKVRLHAAIDPAGVDIDIAGATAAPDSPPPPASP